VGNLVCGLPALKLTAGIAPEKGKSFTCLAPLVAFAPSMIQTPRDCHRGISPMPQRSPSTFVRLHEPGRLVRLGGMCFRYPANRPGHPQIYLHVPSRYAETLLQGL